MSKPPTSASRQRIRELTAAIANADRKTLADLSELLEVKSFSRSASCLTILTNETGHRIPPDIIVGELFIASRGSFDISTRSGIERKYKSILRRVYKKITSKRYRTVFLVPTGPVTLNMQIKTLIRDTLRIHTIDYAYFEGRYLPIDLDFRRDIYGKL